MLSKDNVNSKSLLDDGRTVLVATFFVVTWFFINSIFYFSHNDFMYSISSVYSGDLYEEIHYVQAPLSFYFWKIVGILSPDGYKYLIFRLVSLSMTIFSLVLVLLFIVRDNASRLFFLLFAAASPYLLVVGGEIGSYSLALLFVAAGLVVLGLSWRSGPKLFWGGLMVGLAASAKLNHVLLLLPLVLCAIHLGLNDRGSRGAFRAVLAVAGGAVVGLTPCLVEFAQTPKAFMLHNIYFHSELTNNMRGLTFGDSLRDIYRDLRHFGYQYASAIFAVLYALIRLGGTYRYLGVLLLGSMATAVVMAVVPLIVFPQYLAPASFFCALAFAHVFAHETKRFRIIVAWCVAPVLFLSFFDRVLSLGQSAVDQEMRPNLVRVQEINHNLKKYSSLINRQNTQCTDTIFSLSGAFVVDSGFSPAKYMEGGVFWIRLNGFVPNRYVVDERYHLDPYLLDPMAWIRREGIDFLLVGYYGSVEAAFVAYARENAFEKRIIGRFNNRDITLLYDPACLTRPPH